MENVKVALCMSSNGTCLSRFAVSFSHILVNSVMAGIRCTTLEAESALNMYNREQAVEQARLYGCTHVLFLDSDMTFPPNTLIRLLAHDKDIVGTRYKRRFPPYTLLGRLKEENPVSPLAEAIELPPGCMLIKMSVFDGLKAPYFRCVGLEREDNLPAEVYQFNLSGYTFPSTIDEGYYFCQSARREGFQVWADLELSMELDHYGYRAYRIGIEDPVEKEG